MNEMERMRLPTFHFPFPSRESAFTEELRRHSLEWVQRFHLIQDDLTHQRFLAGKFWLLVSYCFPGGDLDDLKIIVEWDCWAFMIDDQSDVSQLREQPEQLHILLADLLAILDGEQRQQGPLFDSLADVWQHVIQRSTMPWRARFRQSVIECFDALEWEARNRAQGIIPPKDEYITMRRHSSGFATHIDLADFTNDVDISPAMRNHEALRELTDAANNVISWTNDLFSLQKEIKQQEIHNLVQIIHHEQHESWQEAIDQTGGMIQAEVERYLDLERDLPFTEDEIRTLNGYTDVLHSWMRGNLDWSYMTGRYEQPHRSAEAIRELQPPQKNPSSGLVAITIGVALISLLGAGMFLWKWRKR